MHVNWCMFCVFIDPGSYDVLFRLHLSAYFLHHVPNDRVTFYDMHSSVFNIEVPSSSHLFICNTRLLSFPATHFWYNIDRAESGRPGVTPSLFAGSVTCVGQHHYMPDIAIIPRDRFSRRPNCLSMYKLLLSILSQTHKARKSRSVHLITCWLLESSWK